MVNRQGPATTTPIGPPSKGITRKSNQPSKIPYLDTVDNHMVFVLWFVAAAMVSIPPRMVQDQFGMMGLLTFIRGAETDPNLVTLALGRSVISLSLFSLAFVCVRVSLFYRSCPSPVT